MTKYAVVKFLVSPVGSSNIYPVSNLDEAGVISWMHNNKLVPSTYGSTWCMFFGSKYVTLEELKRFFHYELPKPIGTWSVA